MNSALTQLVLFVIFIYSVVLHEVAHGFMARSMGDTTAQDAGRLTLNPFKHLDLMGSFLLPLFLYLLGSPFIFGYAKPVPYDPRRLSDRRYGPAKVALAGPAANLLLAVFAGIIFRVAHLAPGDLAGSLVGTIVWINLVLIMFNVMPIPPLDGHWLLVTFLPTRYNTLKIALYRYQWILLIVFMLFIFPLFQPLIAGLSALLTGVPLF